MWIRISCKTGDTPHFSYNWSDTDAPDAKRPCNLEYRANQPRAGSPNSVQRNHITISRCFYPMLCTKKCRSRSLEKTYRWFCSFHPNPNKAHLIQQLEQDWPTLFCHPVGLHLSPNVAHVIPPISSSMRSLAVERGELCQCWSESPHDSRSPGTGLGSPGPDTANTTWQWIFPKCSCVLLGWSEAKKKKKTL